MRANPHPSEGKLLKKIPKFKAPALTPEHLARKAARIERGGDLNEQQIKYVLHVVYDRMPYSVAAKAAGYAHWEVASARLNKIPAIQRLMALEREKYEKCADMSRRKVMDGFLEAANIAKLKGDSIALTAAWREIARMCGYYEAVKHKIEVSVTGEVVIQKLQQMDDAELLKLAEGATLEGEFERTSP